MKKETRELWIDCESRAELLCFSRDSPREIKRQISTFAVSVFFLPHTCRNSIISELLQSATGMHNFSCSHYGKFSGFSRGILFSREYCPRYSRITTARGSILVLHGMVENERLYTVNYIYCIFTEYIYFL